MLWGGQKLANKNHARNAIFRHFGRIFIFYLCGMKKLPLGIQHFDRISKFSQVSVFSKLNQLEDITFNEGYASILVLAGKNGLSVVGKMIRCDNPKPFLIILL